jgi:transcriptional regulator GlxA family with amidase domain
MRARRSVKRAIFNEMPPGIKSVFGSAPAEFVEILRVNEAKGRLSVPKRTLETIAASVGFSNAQTFQRAFERRIGTRPRSYLKTFNADSGRRFR